MNAVCILGSTGSIGTQALELCAALHIPVDTLAAGAGVVRMEEQIRAFSPRFAALADENAAADLRVRVADTKTVVLSGEAALCEIITLTHADFVLNALSGICGLMPSLYAVRHKRTLATANKESIVVAGDFIMKEAARCGCTVLPVDSEHAAIFQTMQGAPNERRYVRRLLLTASGGPFRGIPLAALAGVTPEEAVNHPIWRMGKKVSVDAATLMNKGLELIEAQCLFDIPANRISVVLHPQSVVHSMTEFCDGSVLAQLGTPDMHTCIKFALTYPARCEALNRPLSFSSLDLHFEESVPGQFPAVDAARAAVVRGGSAPCVLNAADEAAVNLFLARKITFPEILTVIKDAQERFTVQDHLSVEALLALDAEIKAKIYENR